MADEGTQFAHTWPIWKQATASILLTYPSSKLVLEKVGVQVIEGVCNAQD